MRGSTAEGELACFGVITGEHKQTEREIIKMVSPIERDILSLPEIVRQTQAYVGQHLAAAQTLLSGPLVFLGSGSSHCVAQAAAALYERTRGAPGQAIFPFDYRLRSGWGHVAISRTGETTEVLDAMRRIRTQNGRCLLLAGASDSPAEALADATLVLDFAAEQGIIQTRFVIAALHALRLLLAGRAVEAQTNELAGRLEQALGAFDAGPLLSLDRWVFLGRGWAYGLARAAALNMEETALLVAEGHHTLDYRHGPLATADAQTGVWCFDAHDDPASAAVLDEVRQTGATVLWLEDDPLVAMSQAQLLALGKAEVRGVDPTTPRNLRRAIILPEA